MARHSVDVKRAGSCLGGLASPLPCSQQNSFLGVQFRRELDKGGIGIVEMLFRCNILAIVGSGTSAQYPPNKARPPDLAEGTPCCLTASGSCCTEAGGSNE